jgi:hypothetical protein
MRIVHGSPREQPAVPERAKKFLVDYVGNFHRALEASEFYNFRCFQKQASDLKQNAAEGLEGEAGG